MSLLPRILSYYLFIDLFIFAARAEPCEARVWKAPSRRMLVTGRSCK